MIVREIVPAERKEQSLCMSLRLFYTQILCFSVQPTHPASHQVNSLPLQSTTASHLGRGPISSSWRSYLCSCFRRADSAEDTSKPTTVLARVKAPFACIFLAPLACISLEEPVEDLASLLEEVLLALAEGTEDVVMVVFPVVGGNLPPETLRRSSS